jgi:hypothetical protein
MICNVTGTMTRKVTSDNVLTLHTWKEIKQDFLVLPAAPGVTDTPDDELLREAGVSRDEPTAPFWVRGFV